MYDNEKPKMSGRNGRTGSQRRYSRGPKQRLLSNVELRFVYEGELKGKWFTLTDAAFNTLPIFPNEEFRVIRLEFRDVSEL